MLRPIPFPTVAVISMPMPLWIARWNMWKTALVYWMLEANRPGLARLPWMKRKNYGELSQ